jgi:hypothetical protein
MSATEAQGAVPWHTPAVHASPWDSALPSSQAVPSGFAGLLHVPVPGEHVPMSWHWSLAVHGTGLLPVQAPAKQVSVWVQALPSLQPVPSAWLLQTAGCAGLQIWQVFAGLAAPPAKHAPATRQFPGNNVKLQVPSPLQVSAVQANPSLQVYAVPMHALAPLQTSFAVHASPSLHAVPAALGLHAVWLLVGVHCWHWLFGLTAPAT